MLYRLARPLLFALDPETAHSLALGLADAPLRLGLLNFRKPPHRPVRAMGLEFRNPVGLAAGLDKQAEHVDALAALGFGFVELGGVTPRPQPGNPRPRMFRIPEARALINRFGLNSVGVEAFVENLKRAGRNTIIGVNIGKNRDTPNEQAAEDFERCLEVLYPHVHYVSINVSSPNTAGLRDLQSSEALGALLARLRAKRDALRDQHGRSVALAPKIAPDLDGDAVRAIADVVRRSGMDGVIATNTTVSREGVKDLPQGGEEGGLSGGPLRARSLGVLRELAAALQGEIPIIGVGGILSGADAAERFEAGASLVQVYTGLIYRGPRLVSECVSAYPGK
ncbi:MAG: quinone-dependent dihydroorotate dehydrogenase [Proteobacteria bacterium]|nr:quinone-dependent dihydroorotate dehydrogenase [Pseudomonadota bacterium]